MPDFDVFQSGDGEGGYYVGSSEQTSNFVGAGTIATVTGSGRMEYFVDGVGAGTIAAVRGSGQLRTSYLMTGAGVLQAVTGLGVSGNVIPAIVSGLISPVFGYGVATSTKTVTATAAGVLEPVSGVGLGFVQGQITGMAINRTILWDEGKTPSLVLGDPFWQTLTLRAGNNSTPYNVSSASAVKVSIVKADHTQRLTTAVEMSPIVEGASWGIGIISVLLSNETTAEASSYIERDTLAKLEIQVTIGTNTYTWFAPIRLIPGYIS